MKPAAALSELSACDLVIEAATENEALKVKILRELCAVLTPEAVIATNTSSISITRLAAATARSERFLGLHFMNPVPVMPLIELIYGLHTLPEVRTRAGEFCTALGKTAVVSADSPGFVVNRVLLPMINEAINLVYEGVASPADVDAAMKLGAGQPMGPLQLADFIGLDTCLAILRVLHAELGDKYRPCPLLVRYVDAGSLGRKSGQGFYPYPA